MMISRVHKPCRILHVISFLCLKMNLGRKIYGTKCCVESYVGVPEDVGFLRGSTLNT